MSLRMYKVEFKPLHYLDSLEDKELNFLESLRRHDGTYLINEDMIADQIEAYQEEDKEEELPQQLIQFLRERLKEEGVLFSIVIG